MLLYVCFFYMARLLIRDDRRMLFLFLAVAIGATSVSGYAIVQRMGLDPIWKGYLPAGRVFSTIGQPNALAGYLILAVPITAALALSQKRFVRLAALGGLASMIGALLLTYSRGGYLGFVLAMAVFIYGLRDRIKLGWVAAGAYASVVLTLVLGVALVAPARSAVIRAWHRTLSVSAVNSDESIGNHLDLWKVAVRIIEGHPWVGTGPETFPEEFPPYSRTALPASAVRYFGQFRVESPHNEVLAVASGAGIPAAIAYLSILVGITCVLCQRVRKSTDAAGRLAIVAVLAAGAGHLVTDSFMSAEVTGSWLFWTLLGAAVGIASMGTADNAAAAARVLPDGDHATDRTSAWTGGSTNAPDR